MTFNPHLFTGRGDSSPSSTATEECQARTEAVISVEAVTAPQHTHFDWRNPLSQHPKRVADSDSQLAHSLPRSKTVLQETNVTCCSAQSFQQRDGVSMHFVHFSGLKASAANIWETCFLFQTGKICTF